jgi:hypothetical protein
LLLILPEAGYSAAIMVKGNINLNGNNVTIDSYNSSDPSKSTGGQWDPTKAGDAGDVICAGGITNSASIGNADIYGRLYIAPGVNVSLGAAGAVGSHAWLLAGNNGIEPGYLVPNTNFSFPTVTLPDYSGFVGPVIPGGRVVTTNSGVPVTNSYDDIICGNYFTTNPLGNTIVTCPSTLVLPNGYSIQNLTIAPGASLTVYIAGVHSVMIAANTILNQEGLPSDLVVYCTPDVTSLAFSGSAPFAAVLVAPNANTTINGSGNIVMDFSGAVIFNALTMNGHVNFHFDEALVKQGMVPSTSLAATLTAPTMSGSGGFQFNVSGVSGFSYIVESSSDLTDWQPVFTNVSPFTFTDTNSGTVGQNFYRAVYEP